MTTEEMLTELLAKLSAPAPAPSLPVAVALWDTGDIAGYLKRSISNVREVIVCLPSFPMPIRLPGPGRSHALYKAREVIKWAESFTS